MSICCICFVALAACQGNPAPVPTEGPQVIEVIEAGKVSARVTPGHPCRASVAGVELLVGGPPLLAQQGDTRWTADTRENGTTFMSNERPVARIHANQLFDAQGIPLLKVLDDGSIADSHRLVRRATVEHEPATRVVIRAYEKTKPIDEVVVTNTDDVVLAGILAAPEVEAELRGLTACHLLMVKS